jgi:hypothetical protein
VLYDLLQGILLIGSAGDIEVAQFGEVPSWLSVVGVVVDAVEPEFVHAESRMVQGSVDDIVNTEKHNVEEGKATHQANPCDFRE